MKKLYLNIIIHLFFSFVTVEELFDKPANTKYVLKDLLWFFFFQKLCCDSSGNIQYIQDSERQYAHCIYECNFYIANLNGVDIHIF